ncbi:MAG: sulfate ABC transporter permease subunit CysW, partial [Verrucomicrobia bacterium]|nr:sulfate ABC transporter permease subunit CysW [Verrucomicrobiota bacterium]
MPALAPFDAVKNLGRHRPTTEPALVRWLLIVLALLFLALFLVLPLLSVFVQALSKGLGFYVRTLDDPLTWSAIKLTLIAAGIS